MILTGEQTEMMTRSTALSDSRRRTSYRRATLMLLAAVIMALGLPATAADSEADDSPSLWKMLGNGFGFETGDGRFSLNIAAAIQYRYTFLDYDSLVSGNQESYSNFYMRRARLWFSGHAYDPRITYLFHLQLEPTTLVNAHDIWIKYRVYDLLQVGLGRNKIAYGLEFLSSGFGLAMVERSIMYGESDVDIGNGGPVYPGGGTARFGLQSINLDTGFATGGLSLYRSQGIQVEGRKGSSSTPTFEYQAGIWQGRSTYGFSNRSDGHLLAFRAGFHPFGWIDWRFQGDGSWSESYKLGILVSAYSQPGDRGGGFDERGYNLAVMNRFRGLAVDLEWGNETFDYQLYENDFERQGWRIQAGYFLKPEKLEIVARYAEIERLVDPTYQSAIDSGLGVVEVWRDGALVTALEKRINELSLGVNIFLHDWHQHKLQLDVSQLTREFAADPAAGIDQAPDQQDTRFRAMIQLKL
jgi:hypothetical protein